MVIGEYFSDDLWCSGMFGSFLINQHARKTLANYKKNEIDYYNMTVAVIITTCISDELFYNSVNMKKISEL